MPDQLNNGFGHFLAIFVIAQIIGLISHVPGGLGVFEAVMLAGFGATGNAELTAPILGALAAFRVIYYLLPLCTATVLVLQREARGLRAKSLLAPWFTGLLPSFFAGLTLVLGAVLLFSGATRALPVRMAILRERVAAVGAGGFAPAGQRDRHAAADPGPRPATSARCGVLC